MEKKLAPYPVIVTQDVTWGDMDANAHVNNVVYLRYMENARVEYYERIGKYEFEERTGINLVIKSVGCRFYSALTYPDKISIGARVKKIAPDHIIMEYIVLKARSDLVAAKGEATIVALKMEGNVKVSVPEELKRRILDLQPELSEPEPESAHPSAI